MMITIGLIAGGGGGLFLAIFYGSGVDATLLILLGRARHQLARFLEAPPTSDDDLTLTTRLISSLRAGISLDAALETAALDAPPGTPARVRIRQILDGNVGADFLSVFLRSALKTGAPLLSALQGIERALVAKRRLVFRARATTGQCRAQAEVLSWLPWVLALAIALIDPEWFSSAIHHSIAWLFWAIAVLLSGIGRQWMKSSLAKALNPKGEIQTIEEMVIPDLILRLIAEVSQGIDVESACEHSLRSLGNPRLSQLFSLANANLENNRVARLKNLLAHSVRTGAPVRDELLSFLSDLQNELEARWEERVQRLPIALLAPLFVCFFPSSMLVLAGLLFPLFMGMGAL